MQKYQKSKNNSFEKLRKILDNISSKDIASEDEKYLRSLRKRLGGSSKETLVYKKIVSKEDGEKEIDTLKAKVTIYPRQEKKILEFSEVKEEKIEPEIEKSFVELPLPEKESRYEDEDAFEIEKVEISEPEFIEIKPKEIKKQEKDETLEKKPPKEDELTEWEPIETEKEEIEDDEKSEITDNYCNQCGVKLRENVSFCPECGNEIIADKEKSKEEELELLKENEPLPEFIPVKKADEEEEQIITEEPAKLDKESTAIELPITEEKDWIKDLYIARESKIEVFKDLESIDEDTAVLLYDNGFTSVEALTTASLKDLTKINGIKRKIAKKIKKEMKKKSEWKLVDVEGRDIEENIEKKFEDKEEKSIEFVSIDSIETAEGKTIEEQILEKDKEEVIEREVKIGVFKDMDSIDDDTAVLLYNNGFTTINSLNEATLKDLTKIKGIKRRLAKDIKKEIDKKIEESVNVKPIPVGETAEGEIDEDQIQKEDEFVKKEEDLASTVELSTKSSKWSPTIEEEQKEKELINYITSVSKIEVFKDLKSIDEDTAVLLYDNGFTTVEALTTASLKDLTKIKGIKRKIAKKIKKEVEQKSERKQVDIQEDKDISEQYIEEAKPKKDENDEFEKNILEYKPEPVKTDDEDFEVEEIEDIPYIKEDEEEVFKGISSIDKKIGKLLKKNGINSIHDLKKITVKELTKIRGIKKKVAKQIKKEIMELSLETEHKKVKESKSKETFTHGENPFIKEEDYWETFDETKISGSEIIEIKGFRHKDYTLYEKEIVTKSGKKRTVKFFSKAEPEEGEPIELPKKYVVKENKKTGVPYLKKKK